MICFKCNSLLEVSLANYANGGMMAKGGLTSVKRKYERNEDNNLHSENVVLLAKHFGSPEELMEAEEILMRHEREGSLSMENSRKRYELHEKLMKKARAEMAKEGISFADGGMMAKGGDIQRKGAYTGRIVKTENGEVMIGKISGYRGTGEPVYDVHNFGSLRKDIREKVGELSNNKIKELLKNEYAKRGIIENYRMRLENMSDEELAEEWEYETGVSAEDALSDMEDERETYIDELIFRLKQTMRSRGEKYADGGMMAKGGMKGQEKVGVVMSEFKRGKLKSHGKKVTDRKQAVAIALSEAGLSRKK